MSEEFNRKYLRSIWLSKETDELLSLVFSKYSTQDEALKAMLKNFLSSQAYRDTVKNQTKLISEFTRKWEGKS